MTLHQESSGPSGHRRGYKSGWGCDRGRGRGTRSLCGGRGSLRVTRISNGGEKVRIRTVLGGLVVEAVVCHGMGTGIDYAWSLWLSYHSWRIRPQR